MYLEVIENLEASLPIILEIVTNNFATLSNHQLEATLKELHRLFQQAPQAIRDLEVVRTGRGSDKDACTWQDPLDFEYLEGHQKSKRVETCACSQIWHHNNSKRCSIQKIKG